MTVDRLMQNSSFITYFYFFLLICTTPLTYTGPVDDLNLHHYPAIIFHQNHTINEQSTVKTEPITTLPKSKPPEVIGNTVDLAVYIEAQCPDTSRFVHRQLLPTWETLSITNRILLKVVPFGKAQCHPVDGDYTCVCQHGPSECELNQLMNCVISMVVDPHGYLPVISCIQGRHDLHSAATKCLSKLHIPMKKLMQCANGPEGRKLLAEAGAETSRLQPPMHFVPWITINGKRSGDAFYDLMKNLCDALEPKPEQCKGEQIKKNE